MTKAKDVKKISVKKTNMIVSIIVKCHKASRIILYLLRDYTEPLRRCNLILALRNV